MVVPSKWPAAWPRIMYGAASGTRRKTIKNHGTVRIKKRAKPARNPAREKNGQAGRRKTAKAANETTGIARAIGPLVKNPSATKTQPAPGHRKRAAVGVRRLAGSEPVQLRQKQYMAQVLKAVRKMSVVSMRAMTK